MTIDQLKNADRYPQIPWLDADGNFVYYPGIDRMDIPPVNGVDHTVINL